MKIGDVTWANEDAVVSLSFSELVAENYAVNSISVGENQYSIFELVNPGESPDVDENDFWIKWSGDDPP